MARDKGQVIMFSDGELSLLKKVFSDNEDLIYAIRKVFLQFELTEVEGEMLKAQLTPEVYDIVEKRFGMKMSPDVPLFMLADQYQSLNQALGNKDVEGMAPLFDAKEIEIEYLEQQFQVLKDLTWSVVVDRGAKWPKIILEDLKTLKGKDAYKRYVDTTARNYILSYVDSCLNMIKVLAGQKTESVELTKKKLLKDSSK